MRPNPSVGQTVYSLNVGSAARRNVEQVLTPMIVRKVGRKYFSCSTESNPNWIIEFHLGSWKQRTDYCADHELYEKEQDWLDEKEHNQILSKLRSLLSSFGPVPLSLDSLRKIKSIIDQKKP